MASKAHTITLTTRGFNDAHDLTPEVTEFVKVSKISNGIVTVFVPGSTAGITTIEYEDGAIADLKRAIERIAPRDIHYDHDARWGDGNGFAHVRAALLGPSVAIPIINKQLALGTWQQIVLVDCDNRPRHREVLLQVVGE